TDRVPGVRARLAFRQDSKGVSEFFARLRYGHNASGTAAFGFASEDVDALWSFFEDVRGYECVEQAVAKLRIERPEPPRLRLREAQPGHLEELRLNPTEPIAEQFLVGHRILLFDGDQRCPSSRRRRVRWRYSKVPQDGHR